MIVKITNYGQIGDKNYIDYLVCGLTQSQIEFLDDNLGEECEIQEGTLKIRMYFDSKLYPFQSDEAQIRLDDFISREEIEMNIFLSGFLGDM